MKRSAALAAGLAVLVACTEIPETAVGPSFAAGGSAAMAEVVTSDNAGPGSFRQAVLDANADPSITGIRFASGLGTIDLTETVTFTGAQALRIEGGGAVLDGSGLPAGATAFLAEGGGSLEVQSLTVQDAPGPGLIVALPETATGTVSVTLDQVQAVGNGSHGVLINDQAEFFTDPLSESPAGSEAGLSVRVWRSRFERNGFTALDQDGLRINEGGAGMLDAVIEQTVVIGNGGDGIELDERGEGDVRFEVRQSTLIGNGSFTAADFDDGMDIDEAGPGSVIGQFSHVTANDNFEQGLDLNENDAGDLRVDMNQVEASGNSEEGIEYEEDDDTPDTGTGDIVATLSNVITRGNGAVDGDAGLKLREKSSGNLTARIINARSSANDVSGIQIREDAAGNLSAELADPSTTGNDGDGIEFDENGSGDLDARIQRAVSSDNDDAGVLADQGGSGAGTLRVQALAASNNGDGNVVLNNVLAAGF